jgi:hypothetical protein
VGAGVTSALVQEKMRQPLRYWWRRAKGVGVVPVLNGEEEEGRRWRREGGRRWRRGEGGRWISVEEVTR